MQGTLQLRDVSISAGTQPVLNAINLEVGEGELHLLLGPNGSGKSSLLAGIMGLPPFRVTCGEILFRGERIDGLPTDARARLGIGMAFQRPPSLEGVTVRRFREVLGASSSHMAEAEALDLNSFDDREVNVGFSGGEIKRWEVFKLFLQTPRFLLFDEPESGVDLEHIAGIGGAINRMAHSLDSEGARRSALIITHTGLILDYVDADAGHMMIDGRVVHSGKAGELFAHVQRRGYKLPVG
ncbi:ABC transporter ATP-binding protein [Afifella pfennigii]|uniref:ABC transporter ATP-binding protein n=1 Tax=Afifella pfennigii TaxID=209897 RepID=UPI00047B1F69|nr:ATP-binding cassette domain-containing protein [Afifella pfennigii]